MMAVKTPLIAKMDLYLFSYHDGWKLKIGPIKCHPSTHQRVIPPVPQNLRGVKIRHVCVGGGGGGTLKLLGGIIMP